jgi:predicted nucleic acid-binding protein
MIVISNSSPIIALARIQRIDILKRLFGKVYIPQIVYEEVVPKGKYRQQDEIIRQAIADFIEVCHPKTNYPFTRTLEEGERGVLNLALDLHPDILIIDDRKARNEAQELGLTAMLALTSDILKQAEERQLILSYLDMVEELKQKNIFLPL